LLRLTYWIGVIVAVLVVAAAYLFGLVDGTYAVSYALLFVGLWTILSAFFTIDAKDRYYYSGWGVIFAVLSTFAYLPFAYTVGLLLVALVILILIYVYAGSTAKRITAAATPPSSTGNTPAAKPS
jgi:hypothetical protein